MNIGRGNIGSAVLICFGFIISLSIHLYAVTYNFDNQVWGTASVPLNNAAGRETFVEITENTSGLATNEFSFKFTNVIPPENVDPYGEAEIAYIYFDMGDITGLIKDVKILESSAGVSMTIPSRRSQMKIMNRFDRNFSADFSIGRASRRRGKDGINPGEWVIVAVTLCDGKSYDDLMTGHISCMVRITMPWHRMSLQNIPCPHLPYSMA